MHPKHATYAVIQFLMVAENIPHLQQHISSPVSYEDILFVKDVGFIYYEKIEATFFETSWCHIILEIFQLGPIIESDC